MGDDSPIAEAHNNQEQEEEEEKFWIAMVWNPRGKRHVICLVREARREQAERKALDAFQGSIHDRVTATDLQIYLDIMKIPDAQGNTRDITYILG